MPPREVIPGPVAAAIAKLLPLDQIYSLAKRIGSHISRRTIARRLADERAARRGPARTSKPARPALPPPRPAAVPVQAPAPVRADPESYVTIAALRQLIADVRKQRQQP
jgi:hypothetical protein